MKTMTDQRIARKLAKRLRKLKVKLLFKKRGKQNNIWKKVNEKLIKKNKHNQTTY